MVFGSLVVLVFIGFGTFNLISLLAHEEHDEHATFDAAGITLVHVDNSMGPVRIERADADVIDIAVHVSDGLRHTGVSWHVEQSTLEVRGTCPIMESQWCRSAFTLLVPPDIAVDVDSDYGRVEVSDRDGAVDIHSGDARVELANLTGAGRRRHRQRARRGHRPGVADGGGRHEQRSHRARASSPHPTA